MASVPIGGVRVDLQLNSAAFIRDIAKSTGAMNTGVQKMTGQLGGLQSAVGSINKTFLAFLTVREIKKVVSFTEECLKLAATIKGPLGFAVQDFQDKATAFENSFKIGVAQGFMDAVTAGLKTANISLTDLANTGIFVGNILGRVFTTVVNFLTHDIPEGVKTSIASINTITAAFNEMAAARDKAAQLPSALAPGAPGSALLGPGGTGGLLPMIDTSAIESSIKSWVDFSNTQGVVAAALQTTIEKQRQMNAAALNFADLAKMSNQAFDDAQTPMDKYARSIERINFLLKEGGISAETYGRLNVMAAATAVEPWLQVASTIGDALGTMFKENKAVAIAQTVISTAQGIAKSIAEYGFTPIGIAAAAAAAALGAAQIATIVSAQPGSTGGSKALKTPKGGGATATAGRASTAAAPATSPGFTQAVTIEILGDVFGPEHFRKIVAGINNVQRDGTALLRIA